MRIQCVVRSSQPIRGYDDHMIRVRFILLALFASMLATTASAATVGKATVTTEVNYKSLPASQAGVLAVVVDIPSGFHAQSHTPSQPTFIAFKVTPTADASVQWSEPIYPPGKDESYPSLGVLNVYTGKLIVFVPFQLTTEAKPGPLKLAATVVYQLCDDKACYAPQRPKVEADVTVLAAGEKAIRSDSATFANYKPTEGATSKPATTQATAAPSATKTPWSIGTALGAALLAGLLFNIMPCVLPVLPLKAVGFYEASQHNRAKSFALGVVFSLGIITVFAALSLLVLVFHALKWGDLFSYWWFVWLIIVPLLTFMGFGMLGGWTLALPLGVYRFEARHDTFAGNFFWGILTSILATPCTAPLLPPLLLWATLQPVVLGVLSIVTVGVGMALPYLLLSAMPEVARKFPRSGPWTELFKQMMGFMLLASATYFAAGRLIHGTDFWWAVLAVVAIASLFLVARTVQLSKDARPVGIAATLAVILFGGTLWWTATITGFASGSSAAAIDSSWQSYSEQDFKKLRDAKQPVLVKFTANWCATCQYIEGTVFRDPKVWQALKQQNTTAIKVDFSDNSDAPGKDLLISLNPAGGIPLTAIYLPGSDTPIVLSSVYTTRELLEALQPTAVSSIK